MSDEANIAGYEWRFQCECGGVIASDGMTGFGPTPEDGVKSVPSHAITSGDTFTCPWCNRLLKVDIRVIEDG